MVEIFAKLEEEQRIGRIYKIYSVKSNLLEALKELWKNRAIFEIYEENEASLIDDMLTNNEELFMRLIREIELNKGLESAKLVVSSKDKIVMIIKIGEYITWRLSLLPEKVEIKEA